VTVPKLTTLLEKNNFFEEIDNPEGTTDFFVENHNLIIDEYINIKLDYLQNKTYRTNLFQIIVQELGMKMTTFQQSMMKHLQNDSKFQGDFQATQQSKLINKLSMGRGIDSLGSSNDVPFD